jgi:hypothetical protein
MEKNNSKLPTRQTKLKKYLVHFTKFLDCDSKEDVIMEAKSRKDARISCNVLFRGFSFSITKVKNQ